MTRYIAHLMLGALVLVSVLGAAAIPARAQSDSSLTDDEIALLDRVFDSRDVQDTYASYREDATLLYVRDTEITYQGTTLTQQQVTDLTRSAVYVQDGDTRDFSATLTEIETAVEAQGVDEDLESVTINADAIYLDGTLYVNASYAEPSSDLPALAEGWAVVDDPAAHEALALLSLDTLVEDSGTFDNEDLVRSTATRVTLESMTTEDGTAVDIITVEFDGLESLMAILAETSEDANPTMEVILGMSRVATSSLRLTLDADNNPLEVTSRLLIVAEDLDGHALAPAQLPEGVTLDVRFDQQQTQTFSDVNAVIEPLVVPDVIAE